MRMKPKEAKKLVERLTIKKSLTYREGVEILQGQGIKASQFIGRLW